MDEGGAAFYGPKQLNQHLDLQQLNQQLCLQFSYLCINQQQLHEAQFLEKAKHSP
jgi:hypothetical protein